MQFVWIGVSILVSAERWEPCLCTLLYLWASRGSEKCCSCSASVRHSWVLARTAVPVLSLQPDLGGAASHRLCDEPCLLLQILSGSFQLLHHAVWLAGSSVQSSGILVCSWTCRVHPGLEKLWRRQAPWFWVKKSNWMIQTGLFLVKFS